MQKGIVKANYSNPGQETLKDTIIKKVDSSGTTLTRRPYHAKRIPYTGIVNHFLSLSSLSASGAEYCFEGISEIKFIFDIPDIVVFMVNKSNNCGKYLVDMVSLPPSGELVFDTVPDFFFCGIPNYTSNQFQPRNPEGSIYGAIH